MAKEQTLQFYRGTTAQNNAYTGSAGEPTFDTTTNEVRIHDGSTQGGHILQGKMTVDASPTNGSSNPVQSGGVYSALSGKQDTLSFDATPTDGSSNPVTSDGIYSALSTKQNSLTFDQTPTAGSSNPATSGGIKTALDGKLDLAGGTMTGEIAFNKTGDLITRYGVNPIFGIDAGNNQTYVACADGTKWLRLGDDGEMKWAGQDVERVSAAGSNYIRYASGLQMCWGSTSHSGDAGAETITYPKAFSVNPNVTISRNAGPSTAFSTEAAFTRAIGTSSFQVYFPSNTGALWFAIGQWS